MPCRERDIAEQVATAITAGSYTRTVDAKRTWVPVWELDDLTSLHCHVAPSSPTGAPQTRTKFLWDVPIVAGFGQKVSKPIQDDEVDDIADVVEEVVDELKTGSVTITGGLCASCAGVEYLRHADTEYLTEKGMFLSLVQFTYRVVA
jgi:hypothetical protein